MVETNRYLLAILMLSISLFVVTSSMAQGVKVRDGGKLKAKETRERGEKELTVSGVAYSITAWDAHEPRRVTNFSDQKSLVIPALGEGVATVKLALSARRVLSSGRPHADAGSQESIRKVTKSVEKLRWKIEPLNPSATTSSIRIPSGIFTTNKSRGVEAEYGNYINSDIDGIKLDNFLKKGIHRFKLSVGPSENTPDGGEKISSPFTAEILVIDIKFAVTRNGSVATSLIENIDFDEGKKNKVGKFVPDNADVSPKTADGTSYAPKDFLDLTVSVNPNDKEVLDGAKITLKKIRGLGDIRILSLKGDRKFDFVPVPLGQDLTQDYFASNGRYFDWFPKIEGMKPGNVELELKYKKAEIEIVRTVSLDVQKPKCTRAQAQAAGWPTKTAQHEGGQYVLELCSDECTKYNWSWSFFTTNYSVSATYKVGEHQGIFIIGNEYNFDDRFRASMSKVKWTKGSFKEIVEAPYSSDDSKKQSLPFGDRALCKHKRIEDYSLDIYNHGRTVAKKPKAFQLNRWLNFLLALRNIGSGVRSDLYLTRRVLQRNHV